MSAAPTDLFEVKQAIFGVLQGAEEPLTVRQIMGPILDETRDWPHSNEVREALEDEKVFNMVATKPKKWLLVEGAVLEGSGNATMAPAGESTGRKKEPEGHGREGGGPPQGETAATVGGDTGNGGGRDDGGDPDPTPEGTSGGQQRDEPKEPVSDAQDAGKDRKRGRRPRKDASSAVNVPSGGTGQAEGVVSAPKKRRRGRRPKAKPQFMILIDRGSQETGFTSWEAYGEGYESEEEAFEALNTGEGIEEGTYRIRVASFKEFILERKTQIVSNLTPKQ